MMPSVAAAQVFATFFFVLLLVSHSSAQDDWMITATSKAEALSQTAALYNKLSVGVMASPDGKVASEKPIEDMFTSYKTYFKKKYKSTTAEKLAYTSFKQNLQNIAQTNSNPDSDFWLSGNNFTDMAFGDFKSKVLMKISPTAGAQSSGGLPKAVSLVGVSTERNWVTAGKVNAIKNQGQCGSCWSFASTAAIESAHYIGVGGTADGSVVLSEQQIVSCLSGSSGYRSQGCNGGFSDEVFNYVAANNQTLLKLYPDTSSNSGSTGSCQTSIVKATKTGQVVQLAARSNTVSPSRSESALIAAVDKQPVVIYFEVVSDFQSYSGGIYKSSRCGTSTNHAMVLVGYSTSGNYWLMRNSWGTSWGENGYMRVAMTGDGAGPCGMYIYAYYPTLSFTKTIGGSPVLPSPSPPTNNVSPSPPVNKISPSPPASKVKPSPPPVRSPPPTNRRRSPPPPKKRSPPPPPYNYDYDCTDIQSSCKSWKNAGYCRSSSKYYTYMVANCPESCGLCDCQDSDSDCYLLAAYGYCGKAVYQAACPLSCGMC